MKERENFKKYLVFSLVILAASVLLFFNSSFSGLFLNVIPSPTGGRPKYCITTGCIDGIIFANLPSYPKNFGEVDIGFQLSKYPFNENFSIVASDENYWKQPEFYPDYASEQNLQKWSTVRYLGNGQVRSSTEGVTAGYGMYPGDQVIEQIHPGQDWKIISFIHSAWGVNVYQGIGMNLVYPSEAFEPKNNITVSQNTSLVK